MGYARTKNITRLDTGMVRGKGFFAFLCGALLLGVLLGTMVRAAGFEAPKGLELSGGLALRTGGDYGRIISRSLMGSTVFLLAVFLAGLCPVGQALAGAVLVFRGLGLGVTVAGAYLSLPMERVYLGAALLVPGAAVSAVALVLGVREAFSLSGVLLKISLSDRLEDGAAGEMRLYLTRFLVLEAMTAAAACIDCGMSLVIKL